MGFTQEIQLESENYFYLRMFSKKAKRIFTDQRRLSHGSYSRCNEFFETDGEDLSKSPLLVS
jgi:hypothetical protein